MSIKQGICVVDPCSATEVANSDMSATGIITGNTGDSVTVVCNNGYSGGGTTTCGTNGEFNRVVCSENVINMGSVSSYATNVLVAGLLVALANL